MKSVAIAFVLALGVCAGFAPAATTVWTGVQSNDFATGLNWTAGAPTAALDALINLTGVSLVTPAQHALSLSLGASLGQTGALSIGSDGSTTGGLAVGGGFLLVGDFGTGSLAVSSGATLTSGIVGIANNSGSHGLVTVTGLNSTWTASSIDVGSSGAGELDILAGGSVTVPSIAIGNDFGATGKLLLSDGGSSLHASLAVGASGTGTGELDVLSGATLTGNLVVGSGTATGAVTFSGSGSSIASSSVSAGSTIPGGAQIAISDSAALTVSGSLLVGRGGGAGTLTLHSAATATTGSLSVGTQGSGTATVADGGSTLTVSGTTTLGAATTGGTLNVLAGATMTTANLQSNGAATVTVDGSGSLLTATGNFTLGDTPNPQTLQITGGGKLSTGTFTNIAANSGATATVTLSGAGSTWTAATQIGFGAAGHADMTVSNGALLQVSGPSSNANLNLAGGAGSVATLAVQDSNTLVSVVGGLSLGVGSLTVSGGATLKSEWMQAATAGASTILITGTGSLFDSTGPGALGARLARGGTATLQVLAGGEFRADAFSTSLLVGSQADITISGPGSKMTASDLSAGAGVETLTVADGAALIVNGPLGAIALAGNTGSTGTLNLGAGGLAGTVTALQIFGGSGTATINLNHTDNLVLPAALNGKITLNKTGAGKTILTGNGSFTGVTTIAAGTLQLGNGGATGRIGSGAIVNHAALVFARSGSLLVSNAISGEGTVAQSGPGTTQLSGASTYTGDTTIAAGRLLAANASGSATGSGAVTVLAAATLGGGASATISAPVSATVPGVYEQGLFGVIAGPVALSSGAVLSPGGTLSANTVGTLTVGGLASAAGSIFDFDFNPTTGLNDFAAITSPDALQLAGGGFHLYVEGTTTAFAAPGVYHLLRYAGSLAGSPSNLSVLNPVPGLTYDFAASAALHTLDLTISPAPEPSALALLTLGAALLLPRARKQNRLPRRA